MAGGAAKGKLGAKKTHRYRLKKEEKRYKGREVDGRWEGKSRGRASG
jgi:hypothetical protein